MTKEQLRLLEVIEESIIKSSTEDIDYDYATKKGSLS